MKYTEYVQIKNNEIHYIKVYNNTNYKKIFKYILANILLTRFIYHKNCGSSRILDITYIYLKAFHTFTSHFHSQAKFLSYISLPHPTVLPWPPLQWHLYDRRGKLCSIGITVACHKRQSTAKSLCTLRALCVINF